MKAGSGQTFWWQLTPLQRALLKRVAREGSLDHLRSWEGRTVRSLVARDLLRRRYRERKGAGAWFLTQRGTDVLQRAAGVAAHDPDP
ncbi:hypothetical protein [Methylobacterium haplocladii]|uniref:MarR family transcriptional regulator n=1 Tax=Methylobacterium haplocladii TaxID=1176176 RepID=A0A512IV31_9HYPH|nr:hypothetical protein [Methylobacterium haplocladii]GEP01557.1 hypothetical protein MHA02_39440 [Methylobacterium haplocladii]GJD85407.1 hypothetical protein HPGCJGGD_3296 [Methylobacterium haplocladii]GLS59374.1 hypothetical protein GCM10007887_20400 [Methylobacterium haplocladii]